MKKILIIFLLLHSLEALACKAVPVQMGDVNDVEFMIRFSNESQNIYFGEIVNDNREFRGKPIQVFKVEKIWKSNQPDINAQKWFMNKMHITNKRYGKNDFVSNHSSGPLLGCPTYHLYREQMPNKHYLYVGNKNVQYTIPVEKASPLVKKLQNMNTGKNINPSLQFCESDIECTKLSSKCSVAINKDFIGKASEILNSIDEKLCPPEKMVVKSKCINWFCE